MLQVFSYFIAPLPLHKVAILSSNAISPCSKKNLAKTFSTLINETHSSSLIQGWLRLT